MNGRCGGRPNIARGCRGPQRHLHECGFARAFHDIIFGKKQGLVVLLGFPYKRETETSVRCTRIDTVTARQKHDVFFCCFENVCFCHHVLFFKKQQCLRFEHVFVRQDGNYVLQRTITFRDIQQTDLQITKPLFLR